MHRLRTTRWTSRAALALLALAGAGCELPNSKKFPDPVAGPAPRRNDQQITRANTPDETLTTGEKVADASAGGVEPVGTMADSPAGGALAKAGYSKSTQLKSNINATPSDPNEQPAGGEVAALVNGRPIFVDDVIEAMPPELGDVLLKMRRQCTPEEFSKQRLKVAARYLNPVIERELLARALKETMKPEQFKGIQKAIDREFDEKELPRVMQDMGVSSRGELQVKLREQDASIEAVRDSFRNEQMARYFVGSKIPPPKKPDRAQLLAYYQEHIKDFETPAKVRWQQIVLNYSTHGGASKTRELAGELQQKLIDKEDFTALAKKYSDGPSKEDGGTWDWTRRGSLASKELENLLFTLPEGGVSPPVIGEKSLDLVRVLERKEDYRKPFDLAQDEVEKKIQLQERRAVIGDYIKKMKQEADIEIMIQP